LRGLFRFHKPVFQVSGLGTFFFLIFSSTEVVSRPHFSGSHPPPAARFALFFGELHYPEDSCTFWSIDGKRLTSPPISPLDGSGRPPFFILFDASRVSEFLIIPAAQFLSEQPREAYSELGRAVFLFENFQPDFFLL